MLFEFRLCFTVRWDLYHISKGYFSGELDGLSIMLLAYVK